MPIITSLQVSGNINKLYLFNQCFNQIVVCSRWVGEERLDSAWIKSGYASRPAIDKASGSKLTEDIYRARYETEDAQALLESRDKYATITEED